MKIRKKSSLRSQLPENMTSEKHTVTGNQLSQPDIEKLKTSLQ